MASAQVQGELWGARAEDWAYKTEPCSIPLWTRMLDACGVTNGTKLLDIGCGGGGLAVLAAERGAQVHAIDASQALLDIAKKRVPSGDFQVSDSECLPFSDHFFDVVTASNCIQFADDQKQAVREARRVLKPGGRFAIGMWCEMDRTDMQFVFTAVAAIAPPPPPSADEPPTLSVRENLVALVESGGFNVVGGEDIEAPFIYSSAEEAWAAFRAAGVTVAIIRQIGEDRLRDAVYPVFEQFKQPDGTIRLKNCFRYLVCEHRN